MPLLAALPHWCRLCSHGFTRAAGKVHGVTAGIDCSQVTPAISRGPRDPKISTLLCGIARALDLDVLLLVM
ncbi:hypothetical protein HDG42_003614 [Paraburkholderia sp. JPY171]|nr:hypothetical protein [Paraburkholderia atlantica]